MNIRWRLGVLAIQLVVLGVATYIVQGRPFAAELWFGAGLLMIIINPQLLEPYYPRPGDVVANSLFGLVLYALSTKEVGELGWTMFAIGLVFFLVVGALSLILGAGREIGSFATIGRSARVISQAATARAIYSVIFWLSLLEFRPDLGVEFWLLGGTWTVLVFLGRINWQSVWSTLRAAPVPAIAEGMVGPARLLLSAPDLPTSGTPIVLRAIDFESAGIVITRIRRPRDTWAEVHLGSAADCERLLAARTVEIEISEDLENPFIGSVDVGSTERRLRFIATRPLEVGSVVRTQLPQGQGEREVLYQLVGAEIEESKVRGGSHLVVRSSAEEIGSFDRESLRLREHRWVPHPGAPVLQGAPEIETPSNVPATWIVLGHVLGTTVPVFLDMEAACEGHLAILGMTKMGKTTLTVRMANHLMVSRRVVVLDQTGEYRSKRGLSAFAAGDWTSTGLSVIEPAIGQVGAQVALDRLREVVNIAIAEYSSGRPQNRSIFVDEAHQFIPEPAGLGFGAPGREQSYEFGTLMMQVRKYGISIFLVSQRTAVVAKSALSQCENLIAFRSVDQTGLDYIEAVAGADVRRLLPTLRQGEALVFGPAISADSPVAIQMAR